MDVHEIPRTASPDERTHFRGKVVRERLNLKTAIRTRQKRFQFHSLLKICQLKTFRGLSVASGKFTTVVDLTFWNEPAVSPLAAPLLPFDIALNGAEWSLAKHESG